jgi:hypothetical protein
MEEHPEMRGLHDEINNDKNLDNDKECSWLWPLWPLLSPQEALKAVSLQKELLLIPPLIT